MLRIAVTGGIGSGKSTVASLFEQFGARVVDADALAKAAIAPGTSAAAEVVDRFGSDVVGADGTIDRERLAAVVFADPLARADLETIVHPLVHQLWLDAVASAPPDAIVVYDVPLLSEAGGAAEFDAVVVVEAAAATRLDRVIKRGLPERRVRARMSAQASDEARRTIADYVISNDGDRAALADATAVVWSALLASAADESS